MAINKIENLYFILKFKISTKLSAKERNIKCKLCTVSILFTRD